MNMLYLAIFPKQDGNYLNGDFFEKAPNHLLEAVPDAGKWIDTVHVVDSADVLHGKIGAVCMVANAMEQKVICYFDRTVPPVAAGGR
jgi:hypothetical protein